MDGETEFVDCSCYTQARRHPEVLGTVGSSVLPVQITAPALLAGVGTFLAMVFGWVLGVWGWLLPDAVRRGVVCGGTDRGGLVGAGHQESRVATRWSRRRRGSGTGCVPGVVWWRVDRFVIDAGAAWSIVCVCRAVFGEATGAGSGGSSGVESGRAGVGAVSGRAGRVGS